MQVAVTPTTSGTAAATAAPAPVATSAPPIPVAANFPTAAVVTPAAPIPATFVADFFKPLFKLPFVTSAISPAEFFIALAEGIFAVTLPTFF